MVFILLSCFSAVTMGFNFSSTGLDSYTSSFTLTLAKFSLGNLSNADQTEYIIITICDILSMITLFGFYVHWRVFISDLIEESDRDHNIVNPSLYAISVSGFDKSTPNLEDNLKAYIDGLYRGAYEVEIVYDYNRNFSKFIKYD